MPFAASGIKWWVERRCCSSRSRFKLSSLRSRKGYCCPSVVVRGAQGGIDGGGRLVGLVGSSVDEKLVSFWPSLLQSGTIGLPVPDGYLLRMSSGRQVNRDYYVQCSSVLPVDSMTHCVPDWDGHGGELDAIIATNDYLAPVKGKGWSLVQKRLSSSDLASLQSSDVPSVWAENGQLATKPNENVSRGPEWQQVNSANWSSRQETEDAVTPSKPPSPELIRDGILSVNVPVLDPTVNNNSMAEDEMVSWLTYPLDDNLESAYCSEFFGDLPSSTVGCVNSIKDSLVGQQERQGGYASNRPNGRQLLSVASGSNGSLNRVVSADAAMAMGAGRAAGVLPQAGVEAFTKVRTVQPYLGGKWSPSTPANISGKNLGGTSTSLVQGVRAPPAIMSNVPPPSGLPPLKTQPVRLQPVRKGPINFSHFSVPAVAMKASLQSLGMSHNVPVQNRMKTPYLPNIPISGTRPFDTSTSTGSSIAESTTTGQHSEATASRNDSDVRVEGSEGQQPSLATDSSWPSSMQNSQLSSKDAEAAVNSTGNLMDNESRPSDPENRQQNCSDTSNATQGVDKSVTQVSELPEHPEPTLTSSSGGSGNSGKGVTNKGKRRAREEESECQSDDAEDEVIEFKKPQPRSGTAKRTRAAEVHNLSERRRRDRINEKMKALQELIPNSNKADKASMLDEAIEYLKMLQIQLQMMSMRSGMSIPSLIPNGMQHLQVSQIGGMAPMGMGMGMGLGMGMAPMVGMGGMLPMGMGMPDMNPMAAGRTSHLMPHLSHPGASHRGSPMIPHPSHGGASYNVSQVITHPTHGGSSHNVSATSPAVSIVDSTDLRLPSTSALESVYLARQHPLHLTPQTMDVYNAYMIHQQQQQQQQHHQQHLQQQQQHHQLHHMPSDMGSGSLQ